MIRRNSWFVFPVVLIAVAVLALLAGCPKQPAAPPPVEPAPIPAAPVEPPKPPEPAPPQVQTYTAPETEGSREVAPVTTPAPIPKPAPAPKPEITLGDVFFAFDKSELTAESRTTLSKNADALKTDASVRILIEGHCDERGTNEYNLGLGERRAKAAKDYLVSLGLAASRIETISYGEERPFAQGHDESAWWQNRRAHFVKR